MSFKFIAIAYGMLGATAATGYMVQGSGGNGAAGKRPTSGHVAEAPKVERVAKLEMPPKPGSMPQVAMVATSQQEDSVVMTAPAAAQRHAADGSSYAGPTASGIALANGCTRGETCRKAGGETR